MTIVTNSNFLTCLNLDEKLDDMGLTLVETVREKNHSISCTSRQGETSKLISFFLFKVDKYLTTTAQRAELTQWTKFCLSSQQEEKLTDGH